MHCEGEPGAESGRPDEDEAEEEKLGSTRAGQGQPTAAAQRILIGRQVNTADIANQLEVAGRGDVMWAAAAAVRELARPAEGAENGAANAAPQAGRAPAPRTADLRAVRQLGNQFLDNLSENLKAETGLLIESVNSDIGTGD